jgi:hypothetical protein
VVENLVGTLAQVEQMEPMVVLVVEVGLLIVVKHKLLVVFRRL